MRQLTAKALNRKAFMGLPLLALAALTVILLDRPTVSEAQAAACNGNACGDILTSHMGLAMQFENHGSQSIVLSVSKSVGMPNGCSTPVAYPLGPGDKQLIKGHICVPYNASYR